MKLLRIAITLVAIVSVSAVAVWAQVTPPRVRENLNPGDSITVMKTVDVPATSSSLDLFLVVDLSGSYSGDIVTIKSLAPSLSDEVRARAPDSRFGLGSFVDFPFSPWGGSYDYAYRLDQKTTTDRAAWLAAVNAMTTSHGGDGPESQYEALYQAVTGAGREMPTTTDGDFDDPGEIAPGQNAGFRADATKVIAITTDAPFHVAGDPGTSASAPIVGQESSPSAPMADFDYPGPSRDDTVAALNAANIRVIAIKAPGSGYEMDDIAAATGGVVKTTDANSSEIADAIVTGLAQLEFDITANPVGCDPLQISFDPTIHEDIRGGTTVHFEEVIAVPTDIITDNVPSSGAVECTVEFNAGDATIGIQEIQVNVFGPSAIPEASTLILLGSAVSGLAGYIGLQLRARRRK